jgi:YidC/Oxa1 family membrane protein insertase
MDFIGLLSASALSKAIGNLIYTYLYGWVSTWSDDWTMVGAFSVTVIMFTVFLKALVFPLDIWQKQSMRGNAKKMEKMRPALEKAKKVCGSNQQLLMQKQRAIYKEYKYNMFGSCLPMLVSLVVFFIVFSGFNASVSIHTETVYKALEGVYDANYAEAVDQGLDETVCEKAGADAVVAAYDTKYKESFFWVKSIFVADSWSKTIPSASDASKNITDLNTAKYKVVMSGLMDKYNDGWNGYLILPVLVLLLNIVSMMLNKQQMQQPAVPGQTEEQAKAAQTQNKIMQFIMPVMMFGFALFYSSAFTLYMLVNMIFTTIINIVYNVVTKRIDAREKDYVLSTTYKK